MQACRKLGDYNFREYFLRRTREDFREKSWNLEQSKCKLLKIERQASLQALYPAEKSIIESVSVSRLGYVHDIQ